MSKRVKNITDVGWKADLRKQMTTEPLTTKVTLINGWYHCRLFNEGALYSETACEFKEDIGYCFAYMLRRFDKDGGYSPMAHASRARWRKHKGPVGKIKYFGDL